MAQNSNSISVFPSAARTATVSSGLRINKFNSGIQVLIDMTAVTATGDVTFSIEAKDTVSGKWYALLTSAGITAVSTVVLRLGVGEADTANLREGGQLPRVWRITATHTNAVSMTYSVGANLVI